MGVLLYKETIITRGRERRRHKQRLKAARLLEILELRRRI